MLQKLAGAGKTTLGLDVKGVAWCQQSTLGLSLLRTELNLPYNHSLD